MKVKVGDKEIILNDSQVLGYEKIQAFLKQDEQLFFCLSGSAGTGKTTLIKCATESVWSKCATAPTHKAKKVIAKMTGFQSETIHKILGFQPGMDLEHFSAQRVKFVQKGTNLMSQFSLVIIDESSMINDDLVEYIKSTARQEKVKVIFMGDENQLPPIREDKKFLLSLVFTDPEIEHFRLTKVERQQEGDPSLDLFYEILNDIENPNPYKRESKVSSDGSCGHIFSRSRDEVRNFVKQNFNHGEYSESKILAWSNTCVKSWNSAVRKSILPDPSQILVVGEYLTAYRTVNDLINWKINIIENSCDYEVLEFSPAEKSVRWIPAGSSAERFDIIKCWKTKILNVDTDRIITVFVVNPESYKIFSAIEKVKYDCADLAKPGQDRGYKWKLYYEFRNVFTLLGNICDASGNELVEKDLDYYYAQTTHKSQGSTYENVILDEANMDKIDESKLKNRLKYVALSRKRKFAYIFNPNI